MKRSQNTWKFLLLSLLLLGLILLSLLWGQYSLTVGEVLQALSAGLTGQGWSSDDTVFAVVCRIRLPRIILACLVGACLSGAGAAYQGVFQNPMAAPDLLGASSGAAFGAALAILLGFSAGGVTALAFVSSILAVLCAYWVGQRARGRKTVNLILAGVMISSLLSAGTSYMKLVADPSSQLPEITYWLMGSLSGTRLQEIGLAALPMAAGAAVLLVLRWRINLLTFGDQEARTLGIHASQLRLAVILAATLMTAASVSVSGMIGWVGLIIPHLSRRLVGNDYRALLPCSMIMGAAFLLLVDDLARNLLITEIPIGILTAVLGAPFFIYLMLGEERFA